MDIKVEELFEAFKEDIQKSKDFDKIYRYVRSQIVSKNMCQGCISDQNSILLGIDKASDASLIMYFLEDYFNIFEKTKNNK